MRCMFENQACELMYEASLTNDAFSIFTSSINYNNKTVRRNMHFSIRLLSQSIEFYQKHQP